MKKLLLSIAVTASFAGSAFAADMAVRAPVYKAPPPVAYSSWTGCYIGAGGGYGMWNQDHQTLDATGVPFNNNLPMTTGGRGWFGTGQVGCDYQFSPRWVVGAFGDVDFGNIKGTYNPTSPAALRNGIFGDEKETWSWAVGARVGYLILPQLLGYVSGGYTQAHFDTVNLFATTVPGVQQGTLSAQNYNGWFIGSGYEYALDFIPGLYWKTEYRFAQYQAQRPSILDNTGALLGFEDSKKYVQTIRSELVWRFNWGGPVVAKY